MAIFLNIGQVPQRQNLVSRDLVRAPVRPGKPRSPKGKRVLVMASERREMKALREQGWSIGDLAERFNRSNSVVSDHVRDIPPPPGGWRKGGFEALYDPEWIRVTHAKLGGDYRATMKHCHCSRKTVYRALSGYTERVDHASPGHKLGNLVHAVSRATGVTSYDLRKHGASGRSSQSCARARAILFWLAVERSGLSMNQIGKRLGGYDHTTIMYARDKIRHVIEAQKPRLHRYPGRCAGILWRLEW